MTKKIYLSGGIALLLAQLSCSTELLNNDIEETSRNTSRVSAVIPEAKTGGDGVYDYLGYGFNAAGQYANALSAGNEVIDIAKFVQEQPSRISLEPILSQDYSEEYGENAEQYSKMVSNKVDVTANIPFFGKTISAGVNGALTNSGKFDAKYIYASYNLTIKQKRLRFNSSIDMLSDYLSPSFSQDLQIRTPQEIVNNYGTHVMVDIFTGGKMEMLFQAETSSQNREYAARAGVKLGVKNIFNIDYSNDVNTSEASQNYSRKLQYHTRGGDPSKQLKGLINLDTNSNSINISDWQNSNTSQNSVLVDFGNNGLIKIYDLVKDPVKKAQLKTYVDQYLIDNKVYLEYKSIPIYSYWNNRDHFYTRDQVAIAGYSFEGARFDAMLYKAPNSVPVYRYWNGTDHYYTRIPGFYSGYQQERIEFYAYESQQPNTVPIYQYWNGRDHYYTKQVGNYSGYSNEGVAFYAY